MTKKVDTIKCGQPQFFRFGFGRNNVQAVISHLAEIPPQIDIRKITIIERFIYTTDFQSKFKISPQLGTYFFKLDLKLEIFRAYVVFGDIFENDTRFPVR